MNIFTQFVITAFAAFFWMTSCSTIEKSSSHGLTNGFYKLDTAGSKMKVYADISEDTIHLYKLINRKPEQILLSLPQENVDRFQPKPVKLKKQSLDIDITTILLKYRLPVNGLPSQLTSDINAAIYAGWRYDNYKFTIKTDPLGKNFQKINHFAFDIGVFAGPGATQISEFTTNQRITQEYSSMIMQAGIAGFLETNMASFGLALGYDYLLNRDRKIWIYHQKLWVGFIIGVAIN